MKWLYPNFVAWMKVLGSISSFVTAYQVASPVLGGMISVALPVAAPAVTVVSAGVALVGAVAHTVDDWIVKNNLQNQGPK